VLYCRASSAAVRAPPAPPPPPPLPPLLLPAAFCGEGGAPLRKAEERSLREMGSSPEDAASSKGGRSCCTEEEARLRPPSAASSDIARERSAIIFALEGCRPSRGVARPAGAAGGHIATPPPACCRSYSRMNASASATSRSSATLTAPSLKSRHGAPASASRHHAM